MSLTARSKAINKINADIDFIINAVRPKMLSYFGDPNIKDRLRIEVRKVLEVNYPHLLADASIITETVYAKMYGLGPFEKYLKMEGVTDIFSFGTRVMYVKDGIKTDDEAGFADMEEVRVVYERIVANAGQSISAAEPSVDAELYDGSRVKVIIPPEAAEPYIIIRKHTQINKNLDELKTGLKGLDDNVGIVERRKEKTESSMKFQGSIAEYLKMCVRERKNIIVIGETGAGKTTLINALTHYIQPNHVVAILEDTREMDVPLKYVFYLKTREAKEGARAITYEDILNDCLRSDPDRIILTEIRTPISAYTFIHTLNSGHAGSFTTLHADDVEMGLDRLETLIKEFKPMDTEVVRRLIAKAIDVLVFIGLGQDELGNMTTREIKEVAELNGLDEKGNYLLDYKYMRW